jgi:hypothetical protein
MNLENTKLGEGRQSQETTVYDLGYTRSPEEGNP